MSLMSDLIREEQEKDQRGARKAIAVGTWGGNGGTNWDDGNYNVVKEIPIMRAGIVYDKNGKPILAERHGGVEGSKTAEVIVFFHFARNWYLKSSLVYSTLSNIEHLIYWITDQGAVASGVLDKTFPNDINV